MVAIILGIIAVLALMAIGIYNKYVKLKNLKIETNPCREETEIVVGRYGGITLGYLLLWKPYEVQGSLTFDGGF